MPGGTAIGVVETRGMAALMACTDAMLKAADVTVCGRHGIGSGWVTVVISGAVASIESAVRAGKAAVADHGELIHVEVIPRPQAAAMERLPHLQDMPVANGARRAMGVLETQGVAPLIVGADAMAKAAAVELLGWAYIGGALSHVCVAGDVAAVQTAVAAGHNAAAAVGVVHDELLLPRPDPGLRGLQPPPLAAPPEHASALGILETTGYVATVAGVDTMVKTAQVAVASLLIGSGGRSLALARGPLDAINAAINAAADTVPGIGELNAAQVLSRPDPQTVACFCQPDRAEAREPDEGAMGLIETRTTIGLVKAMDAMLKAADVQYEGSYKVGYFLTASVIRGSVGAVQAALDAGAAEAACFGEVVAVHLIPHPYSEMTQRLSHG
jgi:ethanolamine utilization protein EutM